MVELQDFKAWLETNTDYSQRTIGNVVSRFKRADAILPWFDDEVYIFRLEQSEQYKALNIAVKSQIKKAVRLYFEYIKSLN